MSTYTSERFRRVFLGCAAGLALLLAAAGGAQAASARDKDASRLFFGGRFQEALAIYVELAVETSNPIYMCEIGRCHQRLGNLVEARRNVRECLAAARLTPAKKRQFQAVLAEIDAAAQAPSPASAPPASDPLAPPATPSPPIPLAPAATAPAAPPATAAVPIATSEPTPPSATPPPAAAGQPAWDAGPYGQYGPPPAHLRQGGGAQPPSGGGWKRPTAYVAGAVGLLGVGAGVYSGLTTKKKFDQVVRIYDDEIYKQGKRFNTYQYIGYGVGAVGLGTALALFLTAPGGDDARARAPGATTLAVGLDGIGLAGRF